METVSGRQTCLLKRTLSQGDRPVYNDEMITNDTPLEALPPADRILVTAHRLFYRDGIRATGIDRVIAESGVAKKTFYKYYPSKDDLIIAFLNYRHQNWITWFDAALTRHGATPRALVPALAEWFGSADYRGCAFINAVVEVGETLPEAADISRRHKQDMASLIRALLPASSRTANADARALAMAVDGAIIGAQFEDTPELTLKALTRVVRAVVTP
jgi:AcrR family transcriptional regulator